MQPDHERLLRESRSALPDPDPNAKRRGIGVVLARVDLGRGRRRVGLFSAAIVALLAASLAVAAEQIVRDADQTQALTAFRIIDRTMLCKTGFEGGYPDRVRTLRVSVAAKRGQGAALFPAEFEVFTGVGASFAQLISVQATETAGQPADVLVHRRSCTRVKTRLPLLPQERAAPAEDLNSSCKLVGAPAKVIVRLRAVMPSPTRWTAIESGTYMRARGAAIQASLSIRAHPTKKPLAFASLNRDGAARFFRVSRCTE